MILGYNTNGLAHHDPLAAIDVLAEIGYRSIGLTIDHGTLSPADSRLERQLSEIRARLEQRGMRSVIETGARYLLDPWIKHEPTLMTADPNLRARRVDFLRHAIDMAHELQSDCVSLWSGILRDPVDDEAALERLADGLQVILKHAAAQNVRVGFEPEPGMFIDTMARYERLLQWIDTPEMWLTLDVGHLYCQGEVPIADYIARWSSRIANVHLEDMRAGRHEHLMFGEGEMDFAPILAALKQAGYRGTIQVELSRHSHEGPLAARRASAFLKPLLDQLDLRSSYV